MAGNRSGLFAAFEQDAAKLAVYQTDVVALDTLEADCSELNSQLTAQHESCSDIQDTIAVMRQRLDGLGRRTIASDGDGHHPNDGE